jgi:uncharacterized membrane protein YsdA (DUF1294 family)/cold shock CspA family protein
MKKQGVVVQWDAKRAFGFIRSADTVADVFFHVRDFSGAPTPTIGMAVHFEEIQVGGKGPRAMAVRPTGSGLSKPAPAKARSAAKRRPTASSDGHPMLALTLMLVWLGLLAWGVWTGRLDWIVLPGLLLLNLLTFFAYWKDKYAAQQGHWRIKESELHLLSLLGGWPLAWCAHQWLRHKSTKPSFRAAYWFTVLANLVGLGGWVLLPLIGS